MLMLFVAALALAETPASFPARIDLVNAEIFSIDRSHSYLGFTIGFLGLSNVHGTFKDYAATILFDEVHPENSSVTVSIDPATIDTGNEGRDKDLRSDRFFDVEKFPRMTFQSTKIEAKGNERYVVNGDLTIKGITRQIAIPMQRTVQRAADTAWGNIRIGGTGAVTIRRNDFNILGNEFWGDKTLSQDVRIDMDILGNRFNYDRWSFQSKDKPSIGEVLWKMVNDEGATGAAAAARLRELRAANANDYNFDPGQAGIVINRLMQRRRASDALPLLIAAQEAWPDQTGFYARAGEAYAALGKRAEAIAMYEKVLTLQPGATEAVAMLRRLKP